MSRVYNFSAGPAVLPEVVLRQAAAEMLDYQGTGMSVMEMSHRSKPFASIIETAEADLRELMAIPDNYNVLFLQGGATQQFAAIPMNLMQNKVADYIVSGSWSKKAFKEAKLYGDARCIASSEDGNFSYVPNLDNLEISPDADYVYICQNETIYGTRYPKLPDTQGKPLVSDVSSMFLSEPMNVADYGLIYGGVQKNIGPAGVVIVIVRDDLVREDVLPFTPSIMRYSTQVAAKSLSNTPPAYGIYICGLVFKWLKEMGGLSAMQQRNQEKAAILYDYLDSSRLFKATARKEDRSLMNMPFVTGDAELDALFVAEAKNHNIESIKGHRSVGGMRASIYNAMPKEGVEALVAYMAEFEKIHG
ncbi:3-phosphoserine/phosphohydroxythreonine transaminase [Parvibacter caecicola]|uniref:Phosphoserine aminotransferase n=1 Tax=Parvibacter caecicola TaxID=747645 RepID=A0A7W5D0F0_9ACTN|nr:3-phosphoserine/phosphohydroxythreonine transaminase [Parvibacter caecicola]MBB3170599.1 phosphoserine aminotransferase [Parvibacter caecicola]MCR2041440.1 3-phosphoserine/phosphohydroxythreonine transaminase [Parvibacter caecicola]RNL12022.1 3-phosphoserine/phosphohydroxythreonine aminotransferase [Parvibacter caecicola]